MSAAQRRTQDFSSGNTLQLLATGVAYFPVLIAAIDGATHEVHLETYIFADDETGRSVAAALARAARRDVAVRVLVDGFGAREFVTNLGASLIADGVELLVYRPQPQQRRLHWHRLRRLHRKLAVIDGHLAFVGGINVNSDFEAGVSAPRFDYAARIEGPLVATIHAAMRHVWHIVRWSHLGHRPHAPSFQPSPPQPKGTVRAALVIRDNLRHRRDIEEAYLAAMTDAQREIIIANAYFLPGRRFLDALIDAAQRGVNVALLLQGRTDHVLQHHAMQAIYDSLLNAGVRIFEYQAAFLHAKVAVIDGEWATVGSSNIDPFSLLLSREANIISRDRPFALELATHLRSAISRDAVEIHHGAKNRSWLMRQINTAAYALVRLLVGMAGYGKHYTTSGPG
ncbi:MAG: cardiolipin synthase ClsB [Rugosibacter sp.]|nr:MAG: cardiolipin synthase ClsB [Rugosibacter sp.]